MHVSRLVHSPLLPGKRDYVENFKPGSGHHNTGNLANPAGSVVM